MESLFGIIFHTIGGVSSGSFYMPYKKVKGWAWENYWIVGGLFSWLILPPLAAYLTINDFWSVISAADFSVKQTIFTMGLLWGIGGLTYGLGVRYLGMSLGNSIVLGFCSAFGALVPAIYYDFNPVEGKTTFTQMLNTPGGQLVLGGVLVCILGIIVCGRAGMMKEKDLADTSQSESNSEFNIPKGLVIAVFSGILSSFFNFGIEKGESLANAAEQLGCNPLFKNNVTFVVILWGGLTTNFIWTTYLHFKNKSASNFTDPQKPFTRNLLLSALAGTLWFLQFFFYGMGESKLGNGASSWILHMATIILTANIWGLVLKEWKGVRSNTFTTFVVGILLIIASIVIVGIGNSIK
ncbi:MAG: L-rhamnose/proton symporter RhaT [Leadbetterella sp.]